MAFETVVRLRQKTLVMLKFRIKAAVKVKEKIGDVCLSLGTKKTMVSLGKDWGMFG